MNFLSFWDFRTWRFTLLFSLAAAGLRLPAADVATVSVQVVGGGSVKPNYDGQNLIVGNKYSMTAKPKAGFGFAGWSGSQSSTKPKLTFTNAPGLSFIATFVDKQNPTLKINPVPGNTALVTDSFFVGGTARDNDAVANVSCQVNGGGWEDASTVNNWSNWWYAVTLQPGTNWLEAYAEDATGNASKISKLKLIYTVTPASLAGYSLTTTNPDSSVVVFDFGTNTFTENSTVVNYNGAGTYTFKKKSSINGQLSIEFAEPPSKAGPASRDSIPLQFTSPTEGFFVDDTGENTFSLTPNNGWAPPALDGSSIAFSDSDGINQTILSFYEPPNVSAAALTNQAKLPNPLTVPLDSDYSGNIGDRVGVTFSRLHYVSQDNTWYDYPAQSFTGSVIDIGSSEITVLFDKAPVNNKAVQYALLDGSPLISQSVYYETYLDGDLTDSGTADFAFTNTSPDGGQLNLAFASQSQHLTLLFTSDSEEGNYYSETVTSNLTAATTGNFSITLPPQIATAPQAVTTTNGGTASFSVVAKGTPTLTYQWSLNGVNLSDSTLTGGTTVSGSTTTNLILGNLSPSDLTNYQGSVAVTILNSYGSATASTKVTLGQAPTITLQPVDVTTNATGTASFLVSVTGSTPLSYQWQNNTTTLTNLVNGTMSWGTIVSGVNTTNLVLSNVQTNDFGFYLITVTNSYGSATSSPAKLTVNP